MAEMQWFIDAAAKLKAKGVNEINVVSETITTHEYESKTLARAFNEITGIKVNHDLIQDGAVVEKLQTSMHSAKYIYDGWIYDSNLDRKIDVSGRSVSVRLNLIGARLIKKQKIKKL